MEGWALQGAGGCRDGHGASGPVGTDSAVGQQPSLNRILLSLTCNQVQVGHNPTGRRTKC